MLSAQDEVKSATPESEHRKNILEFDREELVCELEESLAFEPFRARQLMNWLYRRGATSFEEMTDISKEARTALARTYFIYRPDKKLVQKSKDGTRKYLFGLEDGKAVESVYIHQPARYTLCISSQVGCAIGCRFCRTAQMGFVRNLKTAEIIGQVLAVQDDLRDLIAAGEEAPDFQNIVFGNYRPGGGLIAAVNLALVPYLLLRGPVNRFLSAKNRGKNHERKDR